MYRFSEIRTVHLEITTKCNARCPMCLRTVCGGKTNPQLPLSELSLDQIKVIFSPSFVKQLERIYMCGNYGDPVAARDTLEAYRYFREINPQIQLDMFSNGSARPASWWTELAQVVRSVHFGVDGLADTNHLYRRGTHFDTILRNMQAYIEAGGQAIWDFIVFRHNEHQVDEARQLAEKIGVHRFNVKKTGRFFSNTQMQGKEQQEVLDASGKVEYHLEMPENEKYLNRALSKEQALTQKYGSLQTYFNQTPVQCKVALEKSLYISGVGHAFPCCWTANQLYAWYFPEKKSYMWKLLDESERGIDGLDATKHDLESIVEGEFFQKTLPQSWRRTSIEEGKPKCCAKTCGTEFDPFRAQFQS